jgi:hypothetical protein
MMAPTNVLQRINDQLVAPRASRGQLLVVSAAALAGSALANVLAADAGLSMLPLVVVAVVAFDLTSGDRLRGADQVLSGTLPRLVPDHWWPDVAAIGDPTRRARGPHRPAEPGARGSTPIPQ